jgi:hypothetical protein
MTIEIIKRLNAIRDTAKAKARGARPGYAKKLKRSKNLLRRMKNDS